MLFDDLKYEVGVHRAMGPIYGVIDHNRFSITERTVISLSTFRVDLHDSCDGLWADPAFYGSEKFIIPEDNLL